MSHLVEKVRGLKFPRSITPGPVRIEAEMGVCWSCVGDMGGMFDSDGL